MNNRFAFLFSILSIVACNAEQNTEKDSLKIELIKRQAEQRMVKQIRNISGALAALGILSTIACYTLANESPYMLYKMGLNPATGSISDIILGSAAYAFIAAGNFLPLTTFVALATCLYNNNVEFALQELQKELDSRSNPN